MDTDLTRLSSSLTQGALPARTLAQCSTVAARDLVPFELAASLSVLPLGVIPHRGGYEVVTVAATGDELLDTVSALKFALGREIRLVEVAKEILSEAIFIAYHQNEKKLREVVTTLEDANRDEDVIITDIFRTGEGNEHNFLESLIDYAIARGASDIHLTPKPQGVLLSLRIGRELLHHPEPIAIMSVWPRLINRVKVVAGLDVVQRRKPQDGQFKLSVVKGTVNIRVSIVPLPAGERLVLRIHRPQKVSSFQALGFVEEVTAYIKDILRTREGLVLLGGTTGSGKTTTLYTALQYIGSRGLSITSIEDPIEQDLTGVAQLAVDPIHGITFSEGVRALLRQDPDVTMIGEIRDAETAKAAYEAALTGHLVLSSIHGGSVEQMHQRFSRLLGEERRLEEVLKLSVYQELYPKLCHACKVFDLEGSKRVGVEVYKRVGCSLCDNLGVLGVSLGYFVSGEEREYSRTLEDLVLQGEVELGR